MARSVDGRKLAEWRARLERFQQAGISVTRFCRGERVSVPSFYQWRKKLADGSTRQNGRTRAVETFAAVRLVGTVSVAAWLPGGTRIEIPLGDPRAMQLAIETLVRADAECAAGFDAKRVGHLDAKRGGVPC